MAKVKLEKILLKNRTLATAINELMASTGSLISIRDQSGRLLLSTLNQDVDQLPSTTDNHPVVYDGEILGWVSGGDHPGQIAALLSYLAKKEAETKSLAIEILDLYREINLLYTLSEKLSLSLETGIVADLALEEASRLIAATGGAVILFDEETKETENIAFLGNASESLTDDNLIIGIVRRVVEAGQAEIVNDVRANTESAEPGNRPASLVGAPLKAKNQVFGAIFLVNEDPKPYQAGDLKLLNALASQAAPALENAIIHERTLREAQAREEELKRQINELNIELDEKRQKQHVAEITETERFRRISLKAKKLRSIMEGDDPQLMP